MKKWIGFPVIIALVLISTPALTGIADISENGVLENNSSKNNQTAKDNFDMVIIAPAKFSSSLQPLIDHKNSYGIQTFLKTTEEILDEYGGRDDAEKLKFFIKDALEGHGIQYVLLAGGRTGQFLDWHVPTRYSRLDDGLGYSEFLSDLYFADIYKEGNQFEDWDSNGNGAFAEWQGFNRDTLDLVPDVSVGRLPFRNIFEVRLVVEKIINYETTTYGESWFNTLVIVGGNTFPQVDEDPFPYEGEATGDTAAGYMHEFEITRLYTSLDTLTGSNDVISALNQGCGFFFTRGRGGTDRIRMVTVDGTDFVAFHNIDINKLENTNMYPVCVLGECIHGKFDVSLLSLFTGFDQQNFIPECIGWRLVRKKDGGAIATITNTNLCYGVPGGDADGNGVPDDAERYGGWLAVEFFRLYSEEENLLLGDIHTQTITNYVTRYPVTTNSYDCKSIQEFILLGDPSLKIEGYPQILSPRV